MKREVSEKIREIRRECGFTQQMIATALNVDRTTYTCYESGKTEPSIDTLAQLCRIFNISLHELLEAYDESQTSGVAASGDTMYTDIEVDIPSVRSLAKDEKEVLIIYRMMDAKKREDFIKKGQNLFNKMMEDDG